MPEAHGPDEDHRIPEVILIHSLSQIQNQIIYENHNMNSSWLEQTRFPMEGIEALQRAIVKLMFQKMENPKESVLIDTKISIFVKMIQQRANQALRQFKEEDSMRKEEMQVISGLRNINQSDKSRTPSIWFNFYERVKELKDMHKKFTPVADLPINTVDYVNKIVFSPPEKEPTFSAEEARGKHVDMHALYMEYLNVLKSLNRKQQHKFGDYLWYLQNFDKFESIPIVDKMKNVTKLEGYLHYLIQYLDSFLKKIRPLMNVTELVAKFNSDFEEKYSEGVVPGWEKHEFSDEKAVYCVDCRKLFLSEGTYVNHMNGKKHLKSAKERAKMIDQAQAKGIEFHEDHHEEEEKAKQQFKVQHEEKMKQMAKLEYLVSRYRQQLAGVLYDTMNLIRKKQTRGYEEQDEANNNEVESESQVDPDEPVYNPKNLPLGWDGKPIPYWLYKLHGLGVQYKCEICGNYSYWGRRAFEMHFQQWRHTYGMKCLRIPNTIHFKDVTTINDALALHQKLLGQAELAQFRPDVEEEFEDTEGNIINRKTYNDMKKQGIL